MFSPNEIGELTAVTKSSGLPPGVLAMTADVLAKARQADPDFPQNVRVVLLPGRGRLILSLADFARATGGGTEGDPRLY